MKVYEFIYNDSTYDGASITMSIHATQEGATQAMEDHKNMTRQVYSKLYEDSEMLGDDEDEAEYYTWHYGKYWGIRETELLP